MAFSLALRSTGDYFILDANCIPGKPKSGWTPALGELVKRETAQDNEWDVCADTENPQGIVISTNGATGMVGIAEFVDGTQIILPTAGTVALNDDIRVDDGGLTTVGTANFQRTRVEAGAGGGVGTVIALDPFGADTATVAFYGAK